jgi:filamentous hemagglutinin family protein
LAPLAQAVAWMVAFGGAATAQAQTAFSPAWFASKGATQATASQTGRLPSGQAAGTSAAQQQSDAARQKLQHSINNLGLTAQSIAAAQARQAAARAAAQAAAAGVPDGLSTGGLVVDSNSLTAGWTGAKAPTQTVDGGKTTVTVTQTDSRAILNWDTFNVGRNTTVQFQQQADWAVLNKVNDPLARPSYIQGQVKGDGTVLIVNRNGVMFSGTSQVNVRNLVVAAATVTDDQFRANGIYGGAVPAFSQAGGAIDVQAGAQITTATPTSATQGGGYALLLGTEVRNDGSISTPGGQTVLAAGDSFSIRKGAGTDGNSGSTTVGQEIVAQRSGGSAATTGTVVNSGLITATTGDITLTGHDVTQAGVVLSTTSTSKRGTVHLSTRASDDTGTVTLAGGSTTAILLENTQATALDAQRDAALQTLGQSGNNTSGGFDNLSTLVDRKDLSRIEIVSGNTVHAEGGALALATGGEMAITAVRRTLLDPGAELDVSGAVGVKVAMESNNLQINAQGNEQRDAASNRDKGNLNNLDLWVDRRQLVLVPAGTNGYATDRWYTAGGLLEVSGYVATGGHSVGEWMAQGGTVTVTGGDLVTRAGSSINLSGGTLDVAAGTIRQSWLKGSDGNLYEVSKAPADLLYTGLYQGYADEHARWGSTTTETFYSPLIAPQSRLENGYTVGRDAGRLVVATRSAVLEGSLVGDTYQSAQQTAAPQAELDGYHQSQNAVPRGAQLVVGTYRPTFDSTASLLRYTLAPSVDSVTLKDGAPLLADSIGLNDAVAADRSGAVTLDTAMLRRSGLGAVRVAAAGQVMVEGDVQVADGGDITLYAPKVDVAADLTAHGGTIHLGNVLRQAVAGTTRVEDQVVLPANGSDADARGVQVRSGVTLDASGRFTDLRTSAGTSAAITTEDLAQQAVVNGGSVSLRSTDGVSLDTGSLINVSSGAVVQADGSQTGGQGGSVQLGAGLKGLGGDNPQARLALDGKITGYGVKGGGTLSLETGSGVVIGGQAQAAEGVLPAGQTSAVDLWLQAPTTVSLAAGSLLPVDYTEVIRWVNAGQVVGTTGPRPEVSMTVAANWMPPADPNGVVYSFKINGQIAQRYGDALYLGNSRLDYVPAGAVISFSSFSVGDAARAFASYVVPADVFPQGMPIADRTIRYEAGTAAPKDLTLQLAAGTRLPAGVPLSVDAAVSSVTTLSTDLFRSGFATYDVRGQLGVAVASGTTLAVDMPVLQAKLGQLPAGADLASAFQPWTPPLHVQDAQAGTITTRAGASLSLAAGVPSAVVDFSNPSEAYAGSLVIGEGAQVSVAPGQHIDLSSRGNLTVLGELQARSGSVSLTGPVDLVDTATTGRLRGDAGGRQRAITVGERALIDVSADVAVDTDALGRSYGSVGQGGSITLGGTLDTQRGFALASDAFVVVKEGARLDASGGAAILDVPGSGPQTVATDGGSITLASTRGITLNGSAQAHAGGGTAVGGALTLALETPNYVEAGLNPEVGALRELVVSQTAQRPASAGDSGASVGVTGQARLGVDQVKAGGFSSLDLYSAGALSFDGDVSLSMDQSLRLTSAAIGLSSASAAAARVDVAAPYLQLSGLSNTSTGVPGQVRPVYPTSEGPVAETAVLTARAQLLEVQGSVQVGMGAVAQVLGARDEQRRAFGEVQLISQGDLRFTGDSKLSGTTYDAELLTPGNLLLRAAQVYPGSGVDARLVAGFRVNDTPSAERQIVVERQALDAGTPALPYSVFGTLSLEATRIDQEGVLRAPLGSIRIGGTNTASVTLGKDSITSVSAAGLVMPYGGTADGVNYTVDGEAVRLNGAGNGGQVTLAGHEVAVNAGALLDLSGGGDLRGAGFIAGRGGSVDALQHPLTQVDSNGFVMPGLADRPVYAIVPGYASAYAPADHAGAVDPRIGQQITLKANDIPGLPAGTYTLLPSNYALLPGAFRVELGGRATGQTASGAVPMRNGSYSVAGLMSTANTTQRDSLATQVVVTPADVVRRYSQYNETSYSDFIQQQATLNGTPRAMLPADAKTLYINLAADPGSSLSLAGRTDFTPASGGYGGSAVVTTSNALGTGAIEIVADGAPRTPDFQGLTLHADDLNGLGAARLVVGGTVTTNSGQRSDGSDQSRFIDIEGTTGEVILRQGAVLKAPEVFLVAANPQGGITLEQGAGISTLGAGKVAFDATNGYVYRPGASAVVAASNGVLDLLAPAADTSSSGSGAIRLGVCAETCQGDGARLYSEGTLVAATRGSFEIGDSAAYGTRNLTLAVGTINAGSAQDLAAAKASGTLTPGLTLNQTVLDRLLQGDAASGAPALQQLTLTAAESFNFFGNVSLSTVDPRTGKSSLGQLVLSTPALYGYGQTGEVATITTGQLIWAGTGGAAPAPVTGGRGSGEGQLQIKADVIELGYGPKAQPNNLDDFGRTVLGFADVRMSATERITANHKGSLSVWQSQVSDSDGVHLQGGRLTLSAPLVTGEAGSVNRISAGGALEVLGSGAAPSAAATAGTTGAELSLSGSTVTIDTAVVLPSGKLTVKADGDVVLGERAELDLAGREVKMLDVSRYAWGGDVTLQSAQGDITQAAGSVIDVSARNNHAGQITVVALAAEAGRVDLQGQLKGGSSGHYDAGGTLVPYREGSVDIRAQHLGDGDLSSNFATLNSRLTAAGLNGERSFQIKQGDLSVGDELKAHAVNLSLDGGALTVNGTIDASGEQVGSIRLAAAQGVTVAGSAVLDAHGTVLRVDSRGQVIESPNRATVVVDAGQGPLTLGEGARVDLRHGTASASQGEGALGTLDLYAPRVGSTGSVNDADAATYGDIAIRAPGPVQIQGAKAVSVYGRQVYTDAPYGTDPSASGKPYQVVDQTYLDGKHAEADQFINGALANSDLLNRRLVGLTGATTAGAFHLRPAVEINSATAQGDLIVRGDLDLSGYRYASLNPATARTDVLGSGEVGMLTLRAGGDLSVYGSINDGFAPPPETPDDNGWLLTSGVQAFGGDVVVPVAGITLAAGTRYPKGKSLNYDITASNVTLPAGTVLPTALTLNQALSLPAGTVLAAEVRAADGTVLLAAGTRVGSQGLDLPAGAVLQPGMTLPLAVATAQITWPKGVALPVAMVQSGDVQLPVGAVIASGTDVKLPDGVDQVQLRPADASGRQARNWAVAQMLPEGSQSWSLSLVAGADLEAADARLRNANGTGHLTLADTHYGTQTRAGGVVAGLNANGLDQILMAAGALPDGISDPNELLGKTQDEIVRLYGAFSWADFGLPMDFWEPSAGNILMGLTLQGATQIFNAVGELPPGIGSIRELVGKNERQLVSLYGAFSWADFGMPSNFWELAQGNGAVLTLPPTVTVKAPAFSVLRTGTGDLSLLAGGDVSMASAYGVYTAGTQTHLGSSTVDAAYQQARGAADDRGVLGQVAGAQASAYEQLVSGSTSLYEAWYPDHGGNLAIEAGGNLTGDSWTTSQQTPWSSNSTGNWLWRQGTGGTAGVDPVPTAWWINFGTYAYRDRDVQGGEAGAKAYWPTVVGFTGMGTLGGGNLSVRVGGDAGVITQRTTGPATNSAGPRSDTARGQGLVLAVGSTGRVLDDGSLVQTGGGDLDVRLGGGWNSHVEGRVMEATGSTTPTQTHELYGALVNLRGAMDMKAGQIGTVETIYSGLQDGRDVRPADPYVASVTRATGGLLVVPGDSTVNVLSRGDLVMGGTADAGLAILPNTLNVSTAANSSTGAVTGTSWFTLWTDRTALHLSAGGGALAFDTRASEAVAHRDVTDWEYGSNGGWFLLPGTVSVTALNGSIFYGRSAASGWTDSAASQWDKAGLLLVPQGERRIEMLAGQSLYGGGYAISASGAESSILATPQHAAFVAQDALTNLVATNVADDAPAVDRRFTPLLAFGANTLADSVATSAEARQPSRFYAVEGDIVGLRTGSVIHYQSGSRSGESDVVAVGPVSIQAGRDIVYTGTLLNETLPMITDLSRDFSGATASGNVVVHTQAKDLSVVQAGRDILYANIEVQGPGTLELTAGRNVIQDDRAVLHSSGPAVPADTRRGASIVVQAGMGTMEPDYSAFVRRYLDPDNLAVAGTPLADQPGKVVKLYRDDLVKWLDQQFGFKGTADEAVALYGSMPLAQQRIFARQVFFAELREGGREYTDVDGPRRGSYLRGRNAIAAMFPGKDNGPGKDSGKLLMYGGAGIHTDVGGDIQVLTPSGGQTYGIEGAAPPATAGLITRGSGNIQLYALDSILLGQSRVMTTFGGDILAWSAKGDINAGRGAKTTLVFTPPRREYDAFGNVTLSPDVPSTGAGIATLNPLPEVKPGDVDLIAPLGTVDAGEAGIRVSGNVNIAALQVLNAANIQVKGESAGLPTVPTVNVAALTSASTAASTAAAAAQEVLQREREQVRQQQPSVFTVRVLGIGDEAAPAAPSPLPPAGPVSRSSTPYDPRNPVQIVGHGVQLDPALMAQLTEEERRALRRMR